MQSRRVLTNHYRAVGLHRVFSLIRELHDPPAHADGEELSVGVVGDDGEIVGEVSRAGWAGLVITLPETGDSLATASYGDWEGVEGDLTALNDEIFPV